MYSAHFFVFVGLAAACTASVHNMGAAHSLMSVQLVCTNSILRLVVHVMTDNPADSMPTSEPKRIHAWCVFWHANALLFSLKASHLR